MTDIESFPLRSDASDLQNFQVNGDKLTWISDLEFLKSSLRRV